MKTDIKTLHRLPSYVSANFRSAFESLLIKNANKLRSCLQCGNDAEIRHDYRLVSPGTPQIEFHCIKVQCTHCGVQTSSCYGLTGRMTDDKIVGIQICIQTVVAIWNKVVKKSVCSKTNCVSGVSSKPPRHVQIKKEAAMEGLDMSRKGISTKSAKRPVKKAAKKTTKSVKSSKKSSKPKTTKASKTTKSKPTKKSTKKAVVKKSAPKKTSVKKSTKTVTKKKTTKSSPKKPVEKRPVSNVTANSSVQFPCSAGLFATS